VTRAAWPTLLRLALLLALGTSAALTIDYLSSSPAFCGGTSGCGAVRRSGWGYVGVVPLPALGLLAFAATLGLSLGPPALRRFSAYAAALGALIGAALIAVQALVVQRFCSLCMVVDGSAIVAGAAAVALLARPSADPEAIPDGPLRAWAWSALGALAVVAPLVWPSVRPAAALPAGVRERHIAGKINVVEFVDFQCPFCRLFHPTLKKVVGEYGARVNFIRLDLPLESHPYARGAAKAHLCAEQQKAGDRMAEALFESEDLTENGLSASARALGLDVPRFQSCVGAEATERKLVSVESILKDAGMLQGLPTTFVGSAMLVGAQDEVALRDAFERTANGSDDDGIPGSVYALLAAAAAAGIGFLGRSATRRSAPTPAPAA
jgi:uncharacterized membrane protein/predicted DsbA family dithiol-disulfide isomerase